MENEKFHPEMHVIEEPTNDFNDVLKGFNYMFGVLLLIFIVAVVINVVRG